MMPQLAPEMRDYMYIKLENLSKKFGNKQILHDIEFDIEKGSLVCLLGPSGCGKTTLLNMISGLETVTSGTIKIDDVDVTEFEPKDRNIGVVFQNYALYPHMTVLDNIMFPLLVAGMPKAEAEKEARQIAAIVEIDHVLDHKPGQLSGGQQQRVAISRGIVKKPNVLLLDEPLSNLDARLRVVTRENIRKIVKQFGITAIFVTHDQEEALSISDKIVVLDKGYVQQNDEPQKLYADPANLFVAKFMGAPQINLFNVKTDAEGVLTIANAKVQTELKDTVITAGVRPEHLVFGGDTENFSTEIVQHVGKDLIISGQFLGEACKAVIPSNSDVVEGQSISISILEKDILLFDATTGERIRHAK